MLEIDRILVPTDGSAHADAAVAAAFDFAQLLQRPVVGIFVIDRPAFQTFPAENLLVDVGALLRQEADRALTKIRDRASATKVEVETLVREGHPADEIVRAATPRDLIVIATHGRRGLSRMLLGSVAETVIRTAPCPVYVLRSAGK